MRKGKFKRQFENFNMLFQVLQAKFSKSDLFSFLKIIDHVINHCKRAIQTNYRRQYLIINAIKTKSKWWTEVWSSHLVPPIIEVPCQAKILIAFLADKTM